MGEIYATIGTIYKNLHIFEDMSFSFKCSFQLFLFFMSNIFAMQECGVRTGGDKVFQLRVL